MKTKEKVLKSIKARKEMIVLFSVYVLAVGVAGLLFACGSMAIVQSLDNDKYLSNPDIPYSQLDNATYTYTNDDLEKLTVGLRELFYLTGIFTVASASCFLVVMLSYDKKELHILTCKQIKDVKFCPECGLEIKRLKKK